MISLAYKKFCPALCNVRSKALNGLFIVVQEQIHNKQETICMLLKVKTHGYRGAELLLAKVG